MKLESSATKDSDTEQRGEGYGAGIFLQRKFIHRQV